MLDPIFYGILFFVYLGFTYITLEVYRQKGKIDSVFIIPSVYLLYTILVGYVITFTDVNGSGFEILIQTLVAAFACGLFLTLHYRDKVVKSDSEILSKY